jgi:predicted ATP-grasp superfamily ATP-dependent carboligase
MADYGFNNVALLPFAAFIKRENPPGGIKPPGEPLCTVTASDQTININEPKSERENAERRNLCCLTT